LHFIKYLSDISSSIDKLDEMARASQRNLEMNLNEKSVVLKKRLLDILRKVEICRARNVPLTVEERKALSRVGELLKQVRNLDVTVLGQELDEKVHGYIRMQESLEQSSSRSTDAGVTFTKEEYKNHVFKVLQEQREGIEVLKKIVKKDVRDLKIIKNGLSS
jgi:restriction endonuclease Mrr